MPLLEALVLHDYLPLTNSSSATYIPTTPLLTLPSLVRLVLQDSPSSIQTFAEIMQAPKAREVSLNFFGIENISFLDSTLTRLRSMWKSDDPYVLHRLTVDAGQDDEGHSEEGNITFYIDCINHGPCFFESALELSFYDANRFMPEIIPKLAQLLDFTSLSDLTVERTHEDVLPTPAWTYLLGLDTDLRHIKFVSSPCYSAFIHALQEDFAAVLSELKQCCRLERRGFKRHCLPALHLLSLVGVYFQPSGYSSVSALRHILRERCMMWDLDHFHLNVDECENFGHETVQQLEGVRGLYIHWDGHEYWDYYLSDGEGTEESEGGTKQEEESDGVQESEQGDGADERLG